MRFPFFLSEHRGPRPVVKVPFHTIRMQHVVHPAKSRGHANHGWLNTHHSFSFAMWHNPERMHFGALRVLNDDMVIGAAGFGAHPHENMEIVSIPLSGDLEHEDSMGNATVIREGDIQIMSAGTGVTHSEKNHSSQDPVHFLQIWVFPNERDLEPSYGQMTLRPQRRARRVSMRGLTRWVARVTIHQNAWFSIGTLDEGAHHTYDLHGTGQGVYCMVLEGDVDVEGTQLKRRDAIGIWDTNRVTLKARAQARMLVIEVPMHW